MQRLQHPGISFATALAKTIDGIANKAMRDLYETELSDPAAIETAYAASARAATLFAEPRVVAAKSADDPVVRGKLRKTQLTQLYTSYFVPEGKPARPLYEAIKVTSSGKCPLCGGVGHVRTLDHYLPKANFPLYSIMPSNLIPCCRDCNSEKLNAFASAQEDQTLHPYFDHDKFFLEKWIYAKVIHTNPPVLEYFVSTPQHWDAGDTSRVNAHFVAYGLADKFSTEAAADLPETVQTRKTTMALSSPIDFSLYLTEKGLTPTLPVNNWRRVMFAALAADSWFCSQAFTGV